MVKQTAGRKNLGKLAPKFAELNDMQVMTILKTMRQTLFLD